MPFKFLDKVSIADTAFEATGKSLEEFFVACALATTRTMINPKTLEKKIKKELVLGGEKIDILLYDFLSELVFLKDSERLLFKEFKIKIEKNKKYKLRATCYGDKINPDKQELGTDVKAITMHEFKVEETKAGFKTKITLDL